MRYAAASSRWRRVLAAIGSLCFLASRIAAKDDLPPGVLLTAHTLQANHKLLSRLPRYTCLETISRGQASKKGRKAHKQDVIRLDIGVGGGEEIYSWPGDPTFSSKNLFQLVGTGILADGLFRTFAANVFIDNGAVVKAAGEGIIEGKKAFRFTYSVPSLQGRWELNWNGAQGLLGEQGAFWVDQSDLSLLRLEIEAVDIPINLPVESLTITIRYRLLASGEANALIPETAAMEVVERNGIIHNEEIAFSHCRVFGTEATFSSNSATTDDLKTAISRYEAKREVLPAGLIFPVSLETPIYATTTSVGDRISASLKAPVKLSTDQTIPKAAQLTGRVREFHVMHDPSDVTVVGLELDAITWLGHSAPFFADVVSIQPLPGVETVLFDGSQHTRSNGDAGLMFFSTTERIRPIAIPGVASFYLRGKGTSLPKGFLMSWRTQDVAHH
jgi:hypothetical protein